MADAIYITALKIHTTECLMQSVFLVFNKESITSYLDRAYSICRGQKTWEEIRPVTVLHLCAAHILKAVRQAITRHTKDNGLRDFVTFGFARLQNASSINDSANIFRALCTVLSTPKSSAAVKASLHFMESIILKEEQLEHAVVGDSETDHSGEEKKDLKSIVNRSPFTSFFHQLLEEVSEQAANETESTEDNLYFCPGIINFLFDNYLGIFPLWSGLLLGSLKRYASDDNTVDTKSRPEKTRDTNCHVEK